MALFKIDNPAVLYLSGGTMVGVINQPNAPIFPLELSNKEYVDSLISSGVPDATTTLKGKLKLSGDLTGTADTPLVANSSITNAKLADMAFPSQLKGSNSSSLSVTNISLGSNLIMIGSTLNVDSSSLAFLPLTGGSMSGSILQPILPTLPNHLTNKTYVDSQISTVVVPDATTLIKGKIQLAGDLTGTAAFPTIESLAVTSPKIGNGAVTNVKLANLSGMSQLKGSSSTSTAATDITLGPNLSITTTTLDVNLMVLGTTFLRLTGGTMSGAISQPLAPTNPSDLTNKLYVDNFFVPDATTLIKGKIQLAGDLTGTAASPTVANGAITSTKIANSTITNVNFFPMMNTSQLKGSSSFSSAVTDISLGPNLIIMGTVLDVDTIFLGSSFLLLSGGTMSGAISQPIAPSAPNDLANKAYVDAQVFGGATPDATTLIKGKLQLAGDLTGTASLPLVANNAVTNAKLDNLGGTSQLKGSSSVSPSATDITLGSNLTISGTVLDVNTTALGTSFLPLAGGTMSGAINQPIAPISGNNLTNKTYVDNLVTSSTPDATTLIKGKVQLAGDLTGTAASPTIANLAVSTGKLSDNSVTNLKLANLSGPSQLKGSSSSFTAATDITLGSNLTITGTILDVDTTALGTSFLPLAGGTMSGAINQPVAPVSGNNLTNKTYVDNLVTSSTPDATTLIKGKIQLAGDLGGLGTTAATPIISDTAITNIKINPGLNSTLKGTNGSGNVNDITLGTGLTMAVSTLNIDASNIQKAGATQFGVVEFHSSGDLIPTIANSGIGLVKASAITNSKLADLNGNSRLKGSSSVSPSVTDITLGSNLTISGTVLDVNTSALGTTFLPLAGGTMSGAINQPIAPVSGNNLTNKTYVDNLVTSSTPDATTMATGKIQLAGDLGGVSTTATVPVISNLAITTGKLANNAVTNAKLADLGGNSRLKGSSDSSPVVTDITIGTGLSITGTVLSTTVKTKNQTVARSLTTSTGATGFQVSATLPCNVYYSVLISTTISVGGSSTGSVFLEVAPTNSAVAGDWIIDAQVSNNQSFAGLLTLSSTQNMTFELSTYVPSGYFVKLRTTSSGTASFTYQRGTEVIG